MGCFSSGGKEDNVKQRDGSVMTRGGGRMIKGELDRAVEYAMVGGGGMDDLTIQLELSFQGQNLAPELSKIMLLLSIKDKGGNFKELGRTEYIEGDSDPKFVQSIPVQFNFELRQRMRIEVSNNSQGNKIISEAEFMLHDIVTSQFASTAQTRTLSLPLTLMTSKKAVGSLLIKGEELKRGSNNTCKVHMHGENITQSKVFYRISRLGEEHKTSVPVYQSEAVNKTGNYHQWKLIEMPSYSLFRDNPTLALQVEVFHATSLTKFSLIGRGITTFRGLLRKDKITLQLNEKHLDGVIIVNMASEIERPSFLDYIFGGCEIQLIIAIDFTGSNGDPRNPTSHHYLDFEKNEYLRAITSVGSILENYDSDKMLPTLGYGASLKQTFNYVSHCFALSGDIFDPELNRIQGVVAAYQHILMKLDFSGPTNFANVIEYANDVAEESKGDTDQQKYFILLIITDGIISDMTQTTDEIVRGGTLPLSIIIVGVGGHNFADMDKLDADDIPLYSNKYHKKMERDIVQFVPFREFKDDPQELARETLDEIPRQIIEYFTKQGIKPLPQQEHYNEGIIEKKEEDDYYQERKNKFKEGLISKGHEKEKIDTILEKGLMEESLQAFMSALRPEFKNEVKKIPDYQP